MMKALFALLLLFAAAPAWGQAGQAAAPSCPATPQPAWREAGGIIGGSGGGQFMVQSKVARDGLSGTIERSALDFSGAGAKAGLPLWDAASLLDAYPGGPPARAIFTVDEAGATVPFSWPLLSDGQRADLDTAPYVATAAGDGLGEQRLAWLRGVRAGEIGNPGGVFRRRTSILGPMPNGVPLVVGAPLASLPGSDYGAFHALYKARRHAIYIGADDGMLHAFDAATGVELFAYVPRALFPALPALSSPQYQPRAFVDGSAGHAEALLGGRWRSVLAAGMGQGARGVFALDISDPSAFGQGMGSLWDFTERDDPEMGFVGAAPLLAKFRTGTRGGVAQYRYFALVAGGAATVPGAPGALFLLALDKPAPAPWRAGQNYHRFNTAASDPALANALAPPALALGPDGSVRYAYAGDAQGNLWRFDFSGAAPWPKAVGPGAGGRPLFVARDARGRRQPITGRATVLHAPGGGFLVVFGTAGAAPGDRAVQSLYAIHDSAGAPPELVEGRADLAARGMSGPGAGTINGAAFDFGGAGKGWYLDFGQAGAGGEQLAGTVLSASGALVFSTAVAGANACAAPASRTYVVDALSGFAYDTDGSARSGVAAGRLAHGTVAATPLLVRTGSTSGARDATGRTRASHSFAIVGRAGGAGAPLVFSVGAPAGRLSWREVGNWRELHAKATR
ncbi:MAG: PilC/PilY family type IV pilus protein [Pseudomonadota bacterium]